MRIQTLIFDFGNVLGFFDHRKATRRLVEHAGVSLDTLDAFMHGGQLEDDFEANRISADEYLRRVIEGCGIRCPKEYLATTFVDIFTPNAEVCGLIPLLRPRYRLLLGSNTNELHATHYRKQFAETFSHFDGLVLSHEIGQRKPGAAFFEHCVQVAGCPATECLFIDDMPENIAGAQACGLHGIVYHGGDLRPQLAMFGIRLEDEAAA